MSWLKEIQALLPLYPDGTPPPLVLNDGCIFRVMVLGAGPYSGGDYEVRIDQADRLIARLMPWLPPGVEPDEATYFVPDYVFFEILTDGGGPAGYLHNEKVWPLGAIAPGLQSRPEYLSYKELLVSFKSDPDENKIPEQVIIDSLPPLNTDLR